MNRLRSAALPLLLCFLLMGAAPILPTTDFYVNDAAGILIEEHKNTMMTVSAGLEEAAGAQLVILTIESLESMGYDDLYAFADDIFTSWAIGGREEENGILIVAVKDPAACAIRVGKPFAEEITAGQIVSVTENVVATMRKGNSTKALMDLYSALSLRVYEILGLEAPDQEEVESAAARNYAPYIIVAGGLLIVGRTYRVNRKYGKIGKKQPYKRRRFSREQGDDDMRDIKSMPSLYEKIGREPTGESRPEDSGGQGGDER